MLKTITKLFFIALLLSFLMLVLVGVVSPNIKYNTLLAFPAYFCFTLLVIKIYEKKLPEVSIIIILFASMFLAHSQTIYISIVEESIFSVPFIVVDCLGIISAYLYLKLKLPFNILPFSLGCLVVIFMFFQGWDYWLHKTNFGTFTGRVTAYNLPAEFESFDEQKNLITENDFNGKIVLLDFWHTRCGICFQKFPQVQTAYDKFKNDSSVVILAVNKPIEEDKPDQVFEMIKKKSYSFPVVIAKDEDLPENFGVKGYPTTFVINQSRQIVYKGDIEGAVKMVDELKSNSR